MINYYDILGLHTGAGIPEIKAAFRQLAKAYHPDLNPQGKEKFAAILKAYEILSDPVSKTSYDYKLQYHQAQAQRTVLNKSQGKSWSFDEREMKRRQYYNEHIRKYARTQYTAPPESQPKSNYNEFKYTLFATPLAVILFLLIMYLASPARKEAPVNKTPPSDTALKRSLLQFGDAPYLKHFGNLVIEEHEPRSVIVSNETGLDLIFCLFKKGYFVRSCFINQDLTAELTDLPRGAFEVRYSSGQYFDHERKIAGTDIYGGFNESSFFYESIEPVMLSDSLALKIGPGLNSGFRQIDPDLFFRKTND